MRSCAECGIDMTNTEHELCYDCWVGELDVCIDGE